MRKLSIIIPTYNSAKTIRALLDSIFQSYFKNYEVIIVDDSSTDETINIIKEYKVKIIRLKQNSGPAKARNIGVEHASSKNILFLDSDVVLNKDTLERIVNTLKDENIKCLIGIYAKEPANKGIFQSYKALLEYYWSKNQNHTDYFMPACGAIRRRVFEEIGGFNNNCKEVEDFEIGYRITEKYKIYLDSRIQVYHNFPNLLTCIKKYYKRCFFWTRIFLKRRKFDNIASSEKTALNSIVTVMTLLSLIIAAINPTILIATTTLIIVYLILNIKLYQFLLKEKGFIFTVYSMVIGFLLYLVLGISASTSIITYKFEKIIRK